MDTIITVIIPAYNAERTIRRAVDSVLNQPGSDSLQVICIDDGSSDNTGKILDDISERDNRVKVFHQSNKGVAAARNKGIEMAVGKYLAFLDADDWWNSGVVNGSLLIQMETDNWDLYGFGYSAVTSDFRYKYDRHVVSGSETYRTKARGRYNWYSFCAFMYRREFIISADLRFLNTKVNEDQPFVEMCFYLANGIKRIDELLFTYWSNTHSCLHTVDWLNYMEEKCRSFDLAKEWYSRWNDNYDTEYAYIMIVNEILPALCSEKPLSEIQKEMRVNPRFECLKRYREIGLQPKLLRRIGLWMEHPWIYYCVARGGYAPQMRIKRFLYKNPKLRKPFDDFFYLIIKKYERCDIEVS